MNTVADEAYAVQVFDGVGRVFGTANNHPGSAGGYRLVQTIYDQMGRLIKQSNPIEINNSWIPAGDDAIGVYYTQQSYDWNGRPLVTTNTDGTQKYASYGGCGCAGGEVVTLTDEVGRQQKVYSDVLGRQWKSELLNWNGTVYSATTNTFNARDQVTLMRQWAGAENGGGAYQDTTMSYDGYGRLQSKHVPEQNAGTATVYAYNNDDTIQSVADARGASATYGYNNRHLVTSINYSAPAGITPTPNVTFGYDAPGNRTSMTDGLGSHSYAYNQLSRMTGETRGLTGVGSFTLSYDYNLAGELKSITDPFNATINYGLDSTGRLDNVTGSAFAGVTQYAQNARYRAWGALKALSYGNGRALTVQHNSRMQTTRFDIPGVITREYQYFADGQLRYSHDFRDARFDRSYAYDHAARISSALSGIEARGGQSIDGRDRPYNESFAFDPMNHVTARTTHYWDEVTSISHQYVKNRNTQPGWSYDADGRALWNADVGYLYDASGQVTSFGDFGSVKTDQNFDGDGRRVRTEEWKFNEQSWTWQSQDVVYYLRSSVLGGAVLTELNSNGTKRRTFVHAGGSVLASQLGSGTGYSAVEWEHRDAANISYRATIASGEVIGETVGGSDQSYPQEFDPAGADAGLYPPLIWVPPVDEPVGSLLPYPRMTDPSRPGVSYSVDGIPVSVDYFMMALQSALHSSLGMVEAAARASAPRFGGYSVSTHNGRAERYFGSDFRRAGNEAIEQGHFTVVRNWIISDNTSWLFTLLPQNPARQDPATLSGTVTDPALDQGIAEARAALQQNPLCRSLFFGTDPLNLLNTYLANGLITSGTSYSVLQRSGTLRQERFSSGDVGAVTSIAAGSYPGTTPGRRVSANPITINDNGFFYSGRDSRGTDLSTLRDRGFFGLSLGQIRGAVILHELFHAAGRIPGDRDNPRQSQANSELVRRFCFPNRTVTTTSP